jgi:heme/copper-type cytochrome/quinol oxidase subunit 3
VSAISTTGPRRAIDVRALPSFGFGTSSLMWWGTLGFMVIEGSSLLLCAATYIYLSRRSPLWPPSGSPPPNVIVGTIFALVLLLSLVPAALLNRAAKALDRGLVLTWLLIGTVVEIIIVALRAYELHALQIRWDTSAYGSIVWFTFGFHTTLLVFDLLETVGFAALFLWAPAEKKHFADVSDSVMYWFFMALVWVPLYFMLYVSPRIWR